jgi:hypothetical protein
MIIVVRVSLASQAPDEPPSLLDTDLVHGRDGVRAKDADIGGVRHDRAGIGLLLGLTAIAP